jgi:hypothetical protein
LYEKIEVKNQFAFFSDFNEGMNGWLLEMKSYV